MPMTPDYEEFLGVATCYAKMWTTTRTAAYSADDIEEGLNLRTGILILLIFFVAINVAEANVYNDSIYSSNKSLTLTVEQGVKGVGFYSNYQYLKMDNIMEPSGVNSNGVQATNYAHGSGRLDSESQLSAVSSNSTIGADDHAELMDHQEASSSIQMKEDNKITYSPTTTGIGSRFYALHPVKFNSLLKEKNWIKNRAGENSMQNEIEYAHALDKKLDFQVNVFESVDDPSTTLMNFSENLTNGRAHIGIIQADPDVIAETEISPDTEEPETIAFAKSAWRKPIVYIDEDYFGTLHIEKRMNLTTYLNEDDQSDNDEWLPCSCQAGWFDMDLHDQRGHSADSLFDCARSQTEGSCHGLHTS